MSESTVLPLAFRFAANEREEKGYTQYPTIALQEA